jgi:hypothetical protein
MIDYSIERQRHEKFVGRVGLLARLDQLLVDTETDRWVVITGGPGMGKSALLATWLARRQAAPEPELAADRSKRVMQKNSIETSCEALGTFHHTREMRMTRDELLTKLLRLLPAQFDVVLFRLGIPPEYLSGTSAPQATRATEVIRYLEQQNQLERLARVVADIAAAGTAADRGRTTADPP